MAEETKEKVRRLLKPTDDFGWSREVMELDRQQAVPLLITILNDEQEKQYTRRQAALMLGMLGDERATGALAGALQATDFALRARAADALGQINQLNDETVQRLIQGLEDENDVVRKCCAKTLGDLRRSEALSALENMSTNDDVMSNRTVAQKAIDAIRKTG